MRTAAAKRPPLPAVPDDSGTESGIGESDPPVLPTWERAEQSDPERLVPKEEALANIHALRERVGGDCRKVYRPSRRLPRLEPATAPAPSLLEQRVSRLELVESHQKRFNQECESRLEDLEWR